MRTLDSLAAALGLKQDWMRRLACAVLATAALGEATCLAQTWTVQGRIRVNHQLAELDGLLGDSGPLEGVNIKVSARYRVLGVWGWWTSWGTDVTDADGDFSVGESPAVSPNADRQIKIELQFKSDALKLISDGCDVDPAADAEWFRVNDTDIIHTVGVVDIGTRTFQVGGNNDMGDRTARRLADIWVLGNLMIDELASFGADFGYTDTLKIQFPADGCLPLGPIALANHSSWSDPVTEVAHVLDGHFNASSIIHEAFHIWQYQHTTGENSLIGELMANGTTHCGVSDSSTAFYEGGAHFMEAKLAEVIFGDEPALPYNRAALTHGIDGSIDGCSGDHLPTFGDIQTHCCGWASVFRLFTTDGIGAYDFYEADSATSEVFITRPLAALDRDCPDLTLKHFLKVHLANADAGFPDALDESEMTIEGFFTRAVAVLSKFDEEDSEAYQSLLDPGQRTQPEDFFDLVVREFNGINQRPF